MRRTSRHSVNTELSSKPLALRSAVITLLPASSLVHPTCYWLTDWLTDCPKLKLRAGCWFHITFRENRPRLEIKKKTKHAQSVFCVITRPKVVWYRRFGTTCRSYIQGSNCPVIWCQHFGAVCHIFKGPAVQWFDSNVSGLHTGAIFKRQGVQRFSADVSGLPIGPIFKDQNVQPVFLDSFTLEDETYVAPKRRYQTTLRRVTTQKTEEFKTKPTHTDSKVKSYTYGKRLHVKVSP